VRIKPSPAQMAKIVSDAKATVHKWWIKKTANGRAVYDKALQIIGNVRKGG